MTTTSTDRTPLATDGLLVRRLGWLTVAAAIVGAACALGLILVTPQVGPDRFSYPLDSDSFRVAQVCFALHHLGMVAGFWGLGRLTAGRVSRATRLGLLVSMAGLLLLSGCELFALAAAQEPMDSATAIAVQTAYGAPMAISGAGMLVAGIGLFRRPVVPGAGRWIVLLLGAYTFAALFPAVIVGGRVMSAAIGTWLLLFGILGWVLVREGSGRR